MTLHSIDDLFTTVHYLIEVLKTFPIVEKVNKQNYFKQGSKFHQIFGCCLSKRFRTMNTVNFNLGKILLEESELGIEQRIGYKSTTTT